MTDRINIGLKVLAGLTALLVLVLVITSAILQLRNTSVAKNETDTPSSATPTDLIAFVSGSDIFTMNTDGSHQINITNEPTNEYAPSWSPDGTRLAFISDRLGTSQIFAMNADGSEVVQLTDIPDTQSWWGPPDWSPDGKWLVASRIPIESKMTYPDRGQVNLYRISADGSGAVQITTNEVGNDYDPQWSPDGELIAFTRFSYGPTKIYSVLPDGSGLAILTSSNGNDGIFDWAPDGGLYYFSTDIPCFERNCLPANELRMVDANGNNRKTLLTPTDPSCRPERLISSPDGNRLLIGFDCNNGGQLSVVNIDGTDFRELVTSKTLHLLPGRIPQATWSPDGRFIVFVADTDLYQEIYTLNVDKSLQDPTTRPIRLTDNLILDDSPVWQPIP